MVKLIPELDFALYGYFDIVGLPCRNNKS